MKVTERGQITLPKRLRDRFGITPATEIEFLEADGAIVIVKKTGVSALARFRGIARPDRMPARTDEFLRLIREGEEE